MSFILDALRKSDAERQRTVTPGLADVRYATPRTQRNIWLPILVVVLAANGVFLAVQWFTPGADRAASGPDVGTPVTASVTAPVAPPLPTSDIRPLARESELGEPALEPTMAMEMETEMERGPALVQEPPESAPVVPAPVPAAVPADTMPPAPVARPSRIIAGNDLPTVEQLIGSGTLNIPMLNLDLHVYSDRPAGRFAVINTRKYKEGERLSEGPTVESITAEGVVLSSQGQRFTLPRK